MLQGNKAPNNLELLSIAQHYGMPTRLLDWTANSLAALWFAVKSDPPTKVDHGVVWMITGPNVENVMLSEDIIDQNKTCFFQPPHLDNRISAQSAWFSYHRYKPRGKGRNWYLALEEHTKYEKKLTKITILKEHFGSIRQELRLYGINHASMIPDLSGLCSDIEAEFFD